MVEGHGELHKINLCKDCYNPWQDEKKNEELAELAEKVLGKL